MLRPETESNGILLPVIKTSTLSNGAKVVTEYHPTSKAVCIGLFVNVGTRDEPKGLEGAAHFIEHMVFKGTETRDAYEIARSLEAVGGDLNAYTSREETCFHATCLREHLPMAVDVLADLLSNAQFDLRDFKKEREVILQEVRMSNDDVDELVYDFYFEKAFKGNDLSRPILGTQKSLQGITRRKLVDFYHRRYFPPNMVVSVVGHAQHEEVCEILERTLHVRKKAVPVRSLRRKPIVKNFVKVENRSLEQVHVLVGLPSASAKDKARFESYIVNAALGGGMTSRLYQKIREKRGMSYTVYSSVHPFSDTGLMITYAATSKKHLTAVVRAILREIKSLKVKGMRTSEIEAYKTQVIGEILLDADNIENRMQSLGANLLLHGRPRTVEDVVADVKSVNADTVQNFFRKYFDLEKMGILVMGDVPVERTEKLLSQIL